MQRLLTVAVLLTFAAGTAVAEPHHPLSDIYPMDVPLDLQGQPVQDSTGQVAVSDTLNLTGNNLIDYITDPRPTAPSSPAAGQMWFDTSQNTLKYYNGSSWIITASTNSIANNLQEVLAEGNTAGSYDINMTGQDLALEGGSVRDTTGAVTLAGDVRLPSGNLELGGGWLSQAGNGVRFSSSTGRIRSNVSGSSEILFQTSDGSGSSIYTRLRLSDGSDVEIRNSNLNLTGNDIINTRRILPASDDATQLDSDGETRIRDLKQPWTYHSSPGGLEQNAWFRLDQQGGVTVTVEDAAGNTWTDPRALFDRPGNEFQVNTANLPVTISMDFGSDEQYNGMGAIGYRYGRRANDIQIDVQRDDGTWYTHMNRDGYTSNTQIWPGWGSHNQKFNITLSNPSSKAINQGYIRISNLFQTKDPGPTRRDQGGALVYAGGDNMYGTLDMNGNNIREAGPFEDCRDILQKGASTGDGFYTIDPDGYGGTLSFDVYCDMSTDGGGWTLMTANSGDPPANLFRTTSNNRDPANGDVYTDLTLEAGDWYEHIRWGPANARSTNWNDVDYPVYNKQGAGTTAWFRCTGTDSSCTYFSPRLFFKCSWGGPYKALDYTNTNYNDGRSGTPPFPNSDWNIPNYGESSNNWEGVLPGIRLSDGSTLSDTYNMRGMDCNPSDVRDPRIQVWVK